jgi:hypothetical protein
VARSSPRRAARRRYGLGQDAPSHFRRGYDRGATHLSRFVSGGENPHIDGGGFILDEHQGSQALGSRIVARLRVRGCRRAHGRPGRFAPLRGALRASLTAAPPVAFGTLRSGRRSGSLRRETKRDWYISDSVTQHNAGRTVGLRACMFPSRKVNLRTFIFLSRRHDDILLKQILS